MIFSEGYFIKTKRKTPAIVTPLGITGLGLLRSLAKYGVPVIALDSNPYQPAFLSRYGKKLVCPDINNEYLFLDFLTHLGKNQGFKSILFPTSDRMIMFISRHKEILQEYFVFSTSSKVNLEHLTNKEFTYKLAEKHGVNVPKTLFPRNEEDLKKVETQIGFPCLIKPLYSFIWHKYRQFSPYINGKVALANNLEELQFKYEELSKLDHRLMVQEMVEGDDNNLYELSCYIDRNGEVLGSFVGRKVRVLPPLFGTGCFVESEAEPEIVDVGTKFLQNIGYTGLANVEFKRDSQNGKLKLLEINFRYGLWDFLGTCCGMNLPYIAYLDLCGKPEPQKRNYRKGIRWVSIEDDLYAFLNLWRNKKISFREWLLSLKRVRAFAVFSWDDPVPFLRVVSNLIKAGLQCFKS